jgi:hypothetical protein
MRYSSYRICHNVLAVDPSAPRAVAKIGEDEGAGGSELSC